MPLASAFEPSHGIARSLLVPRADACRSLRLSNRRIAPSVLMPHVDATLGEAMVKRAYRPFSALFVPMRLPSEADLTQWEAGVTSLG